MNSSIHELTGVCWQKCVYNSLISLLCHPGWHVLTRSCRVRCVTGTPGRSFSRNESNCLANCVDRFFDASLYMVKEVQDKVF